MGDMAKSPFVQLLVFLSLSLLFFTLNYSISKTVRGIYIYSIGLNFGTQVGSDDLTCSDLSNYL